MTISSINLAMSASSWGAYNQKLTAATRQKLIELNIPFDDNTTEAQAKALIARELQKPNKSNNSKDEKSKNNTSKDTLFEQARELAKKLNIDVDEKNFSLEDLLKEIEQTISSKISQNKNNQKELLELMSLSEALANLQAQSQGSMGFDNSNQALMKSLELMGEYNKNFLNR